MGQINTAIILDGGETPGHLEGSNPMGLIEFSGECFFEKQIAKLMAIGIKNVIISGNKFTDEYDDFLKKNQSLYKNINIYSTKEKLPLGSGGAAKNTMLNTNTELAMIINGNSFIDVDYAKFINFHFENKFENSVCVTKKTNAIHTYTFETKENAITKIIQSDSPQSDKLKNAGLYIIDSEVFNITHLQCFSLAKNVLPHFCDGTFGAYETENTLYTTETSDAYKNTTENLK